MGLEFRMLGDVEVRGDDGRPVDLGHARQRCVLVALLVDANRTVPVDQLVARVWGARPPHRARETLYNYLSRLRRALGAVNDVEVRRQAGGYVLSVDPMAVDAHLFQQLVTRARAMSDDDEMLTLFEQALALWRGEPFAGLDTEWVNAVRTTLERDRLAVELDRADLQLRRGRHSWLLSQLLTRAQEYPLDERVAGQLMLALYQCGRQADALEHFQRLRLRLAEELGIDPGPDLRRRYEQILRNDPVLAASSASPSPAVLPAESVPHQLPGHTPHFVGRASELDMLTTLLDTTTQAAGSLTIIAIDGTAGVGKTTLALLWAHRVAKRFPDGQLYVNLRGFDPTGTAVHPADALRGFLEAFALPPERIPASLDALASRYRSLLANRRVLIVLDNAHDAEQVRPLLPANCTCLVIVTSRSRLTGLVAQEGAQPITLDVLSGQEARALLVRRLGPDWISTDPDTINDLIGYCARLPLALAIVTARAVTHAGLPLRVLAEELADEHTRLDALDTGEASTSVRAVFSWSHRHLRTDTARLFRLLGLHPGPDFTLPAAAHLADLHPHQVCDALTELTRAHLLSEHIPGRYTFHDLLRAYAADLAITHEPEDDQRTALTRLFDHYLRTVTAAMDTLHPADRHHRPDFSVSTQPSTAVSALTTAQRWLDAERANLTAIIAYTAAHCWHAYTLRLADTILLRYLDFGGPYRGGHFHDALAMYTHVRTAAQHTEDRATEALALINLGIVHWRQGRWPSAIEHYQRALCLCQETGNRIGEGLALTNLGISFWIQGHYERAADSYQRALTTCGEIGDRAGQARALIGIGLVDWRTGRHRRAIDHLQQALITGREVGDRPSEVWALTSIGLIDGWQGRYQQAIDYHQQALVICRELGNRASEAQVLTNLGKTYQQAGHYHQAIDHQQQSLAMFRENGDRASEAQGLNGLGEAYHDNEQPSEALIQHTTALHLATEVGDRFEQARAHHGLGHAHHANGDVAQARSYWQQALTRYTELGVPDAEYVRSQLAL